MSQGLFELRKDAITGWWVATVVDRTFARERFATPALPIEDRGDCFNCRMPAGDGIRLRTLKDFAFTVAGTEEEAHAREGSVAQVTISDARAAGSWRTVVAPPGEHRPLHAVGTATIEGLLARCRDEIHVARAANRTQHLQVVQNWGAQAGARTNHLCFDLYDLPQIPHRVGEELGGAARFLIREGECPYCRHVREEVRRPDHLLYADDHAVAFAPYASRSPFEVWVVPRRHDADFARASDRDVAATAEALRQVLGRLSASLDGPPYNLVLHTAPAQGAGGRDVPLALGDPPPVARDRGAGAGHRPPRQPGVAGGRGGRAAVRRRHGGPSGAPDSDDRDGGRPSHGGRRHRHNGSGRPAPVPGDCPILAIGAFVVADPFRLEQRRVLPVGLSVSAGWDRDEAFRFVEDLFAKHQREIYSYLLRMLRDPELAADLTQDAFVKAYRAYDSLEKPENARAWLYQIAHRVALDNLRRQQDRALHPPRR